MAQSFNSKTSLFHDLVGESYKMNTKLWARGLDIASNPSQDLHREVAEQHKAVETVSRDPLHVVQGKVAEELQGEHPTAAVDYYKVHLACAEVWAQRINEKKLRDRYNIDPDKCRCYDGSIMSSLLVAEIMESADHWWEHWWAKQQTRGLLDMALFRGWVDALKEKFQDAEMGGFIWKNV